MLQNLASNQPQIAPSLPLELTAERFTRVDQLYQLVPAWEQLAARALESNIFYEPWMMLPALEQFGGRQRIEVIAVYGSDGTTKRLVGLFPFERRGRFSRRRVRSLRYYYCSLCTPLIDPDADERVVAEALAALETRADQVEFDLVAADGRVAEWIAQAGAKYGECQPGARIDRAFMRRAESVEAYISRNFSREAKKKDLARLERRLNEQGRLTMQSLQAEEPLDQWLDEFLALEAAGWKGREGSALASVVGGGTFFRRICREAHARGRLEMLALRLDDKPIAQMCLMRTGGGAIFLRTAYDEAYARFSPGLLLAFKFSCQLHEQPGIDWIDSCSDPRAVMANRVWKERRPLMGLHVPVGRTPWLIRSIASLRRAFGQLLSGSS
jgi:CelD/BcsL family acetyltransferase involved in cellulose biosynthesis